MSNANSINQVSNSILTTGKLSSSSTSSCTQSSISRLWSCLYCGWKFDSKMKLKNHGLESHPIENNYFKDPVCSDCGHIFQEFRKYMNHIEDTGHMKHKYLDPQTSSSKVQNLNPVVAFVKPIPSVNAVINKTSFSSFSNKPTGSTRSNNHSFSSNHSNLIEQSSHNQYHLGTGNFKYKNNYENSIEYYPPPISKPQATFSNQPNSVRYRNDVMKSDVRHVDVVFTDKRNIDSNYHYSRVKHFQIPPVRYVIYIGKINYRSSVTQQYLSIIQMTCAWWLRDTTINGRGIVANTEAMDEFTENAPHRIILFEMKSLINSLHYCQQNRVSIIKICSTSELLIRSLRNNIFESEMKIIQESFETVITLLNQFLYYEFELINEQELSIITNI